jgi:gas vesicle protein
MASRQDYLSLTLLFFKPLKTKTMTTGMKMLLVLLGGAVVGAAAALMFAPKSGRELRAEIAAIAREKYKNMNMDEISHLVDKVMKRIKNGLCNCQCKADLEAAVEDAAK